MVALSPNHMGNIHFFVVNTKALQLQQGQCIYSYDVKTLFISLPVEPAISIIKNKLQKTHNLKVGRPLSFNTL